MSNPQSPDLKRYLGKKIQIRLNANRVVNGILRGYDQFMNLVLEEVIQILGCGQNKNVGISVLRGDSILTIESLDQIDK